MSAYPIELNKETGLCWSHRRIEGEVHDKDFCDIDEDNINGKNSFDELISWMQDTLPACVTKTHDNLTLADFKASAQDENTNQMKYREKFQDFSQTALEASLQAIVKEQRLWEIDGGGFGV